MGIVRKTCSCHWWWRAWFGSSLGIEKRKTGSNCFGRAPSLLYGKLDDTGAEMLTKIANKNGINIVVGAKIAEITGSDKVDGVLLEDGTKIAADIVIVSTGVRANKELAKQQVCWQIVQLW